ncbi:hypothetical protein DMH02_019010 [Streptomyces sp. WAC 00631]|uniref:hypothetical protein n=1 Tax=unclassified Streptomyces TaxID=2593676 RepID=UPI000F7983B2|nr:MULTISPECIES: hypothetical protein [unclassified Streptomyces]MCC5035246.1 hypothetical protein [Streptomyces sp. WAC 00631]MCC9739694.1 hypothetical protein [Streptomyces sp. MNU89]
MHTAIAVTAPDLVLPALDRQTPPATVLAPEMPLEDALARTYGLIESHGYLIVLYPASVPGAVHRRLHGVRSILESDRIALLRLELPPLAVAVLAHQLRRLSLCDFSPGILGSAARLLTHYVHAGALLSSVSRLDHVPVGLREHAKSWVPGSQFAVLASPEPRLTRVTPGGTVPGGPQYGTELVVARGQSPSDWVFSTLVPAWRVHSVREATLPADSARWWGSGRLVEFAAAIPDLSILYQLVASVRTTECRWCGLELIGDRCAFCCSPVAAGSAALTSGAAT